MENRKILKREALQHNLRHFCSKKLCAMVKCNAYGHGIGEVVSAVENEVESFGVVSEKEALMVRKFTQKPILICAKVKDFKLCKKHGFEVIVEDELDLRKCLDLGLKNSLHLKLDCGMNRFGLKSELNAQLINKLLEEEKVLLKSICTHFPCTSNKHLTMQNYQEFMKLRSHIMQDAKLCFGGSGILKFPFDFDVLRLGIGMYGYGEKHLMPVMEIRSYVSKIFYVKKGDCVGYDGRHKAAANEKIAIVPVGYGDGLRRNLSEKLCVKINNKKFYAVGNICMDCFFVKVDKSVKEGDEVVVMTNAAKLAKKTDTICYEILTGFSNFRGATSVE